MFEKMLERKIGYFPTLREVRDGLIGGQLRELAAVKHKWNDKTKYKLIRQLYVEKWK